MPTLWPRSGSLEFDNSAIVAPGAKAYFYEGSTTTPWPVYHDADQLSVHTDPVTADANGRWPTVFVPYIANYDVKITTAGGTQLSYPTEIPNADPSVSVPAALTTDLLFQTGDIKFRHATGTLSGYVRCNGRTIGSGASGATERANDDTADLFAYLWNGFSNSILAVSTGRGASAAADFAANKTIAVFDMRMGGAVGVDDMGNSAASRGGSISFTNGSSVTGGSHLGSNTQTLSTANLPSITPAGTISQITPAGSISQITPAGSISQITPAGTVSRPTITVTNGGSQVQFTASATTVGAGGLQIASSTITAALDSDPTFTGTPTTPTFTGTPTTPTFTGTPTTPTFTGTSFGSGTAHNIVSYGVSGTWYMKI